MKAGWAVKPLGALCEILDSQRKPITKRDRKPGANPYYWATGIQDFVEGYLFDEPLVLVGEDGAKWASGENTAFAIEGKCWVNNHAHVLRPNRTLLNDNWLIHFLVHSDLSPFVSGLTVPKLNQGNLREIPIPLPPLPEQRRIVALLDEAFAGIATAKANAEKNLQNARALFESHLQSVFTERGEGWVETTIGQVAEVFDGPHATPKTVNFGPVFLGISALQDGRLDLGATRHVTPEDFRLWTRRVKPQVDDVVFSYETRLGQAAIIPPALECCLGRRMGLVRPNREKLDPWFFVYQYISPPFRSFLESKIVRGATVDRIALKEFPSFPICLPSLDEQKRMAAQCEILRAETQRLESLYQQKIAALDELKQSLLHQAFSGQL
jgi:type I restriction enzyme S subunit